jgi:hypothetical protein
MNTLVMNVYGSGLPQTWQEASDEGEYIWDGLTKVIRGSISYNDAGRNGVKLDE